jgi:hypothetical protein
MTISSPDKTAYSGLLSLTWPLAFLVTDFANTQITDSSSDGSKAFVSTENCGFNWKSAFSVWTQVSETPWNCIAVALRTNDW